LINDYNNKNSATDQSIIQTESNVNESFFNEKNTDTSKIDSVQPPLDRVSERITKKPFGIFVTPKNSPVSPEKFQGYHVGTDLEIFSDEVDADVVIKTICAGDLALKKTASGYGGVAVQNCVLENNLTTVVHGHLRFSSMRANVGDSLKTGENLGVLGKAYGSETNGERKHLHLGVHRGAEIDIRGYVQKEKDLINWIDPCDFFCN